MPSVELRSTAEINTGVQLLRPTTSSVPFVQRGHGGVKLHQAAEDPF